MLSDNWMCNRSDDGADTGAIAKRRVERQENHRDRMSHGSAVCVRRVTHRHHRNSWYAGTAGTMGTPPSAAEAMASASKFQLTNASAAPSGAPTTTAEAPDAQKASGGQTYQLIANPTALQAHVGKKLELTGTLEDQPSTAGAAESKGPSLKVESGKVIAESCP